MEGRVGGGGRIGHIAIGGIVGDLPELADLLDTMRTVIGLQCLVVGFPPVAAGSLRRRVALVAPSGQERNHVGDHAVACASFSRSTAFSNRARAAPRTAAAVSASSMATASLAGPDCSLTMPPGHRTGNPDPLPPAVVSGRSWPALSRRGPRSATALG